MVAAVRSIATYRTDQGDAGNPSTAERVTDMSAVDDRSRSRLSDDIAADVNSGLAKDGVERSARSTGAESASPRRRLRRGWG